MAKKNNLRYYEAVGRRKSATARVRLYFNAKEKEVNIGDLKIKKGEIIVNKKPIAEYFGKHINKDTYLIPFTLTNSQDRFAVSAQVKGGGFRGQLDAIRLASSRALVKKDESDKTKLRGASLLTVDARVKERRKVGTGGKARRKKQSPKR